MKTRILVIAIIALMVAAGFAIGAKNAAEKTAETKASQFKTEMDKVSYILGTNIGRYLKQSKLTNLEYDAFITIKGKDDNNDRHRIEWTVQMDIDNLMLKVKLK